MVDAILLRTEDLEYGIAAAVVVGFDSDAAAGIAVAAAAHAAAVAAS